MRHGSLCSGYEGLGAGLAQVFSDLGTAWVSDIDPGACKVLAHRFPDVPNIGDMTAVDWSQVEPVDILSGGYPCQPFSHAGKRKGRDDERNLWPYVREAIRVLRPRLGLFENVRGHLTLGFSEVMLDLNELGYDTRWVVIRASDVGAPHQRARVFILGEDRYGRPLRGRDCGAEGDWHPCLRGDEGAEQDWPTTGRDTRPTAIRDLRRRSLGESAVDDRPDSGRLRGQVADDRGDDRRDGLRPELDLLPTPRTSDTNGAGPADGGGGAVALLPTPAAQEPGGSAERHHERLRDHDGRDPSFLPLSMAVQLLPTPTTADHKASGSAGYSIGHDGTTLTDATVRQPERWGKYADAIARWETLTREAPAPTEPGRNGNPRLSPAFTEWLMGLPAGWITDVPGITRNEALRLAGNGVVPQQCAAALTYLLTQEEAPWPTLTARSGTQRRTASRSCTTRPRPNT